MSSAKKKQKTKKNCRHQEIRPCVQKRKHLIPQGILARDQMKCLCTLQAIVKEEKEERSVHYLQEI